MAKTVNPLDDLRLIAGAMIIASQAMTLRRMGFDSVCTMNLIATQCGRMFKVGCYRRITEGKPK
ncbi:MAG: hypothetical protein PHI06_02750 [Desulfobulbaceae bacterium]|nr:hypothetical protein [Desulfobulbaceae bacterium]